MTIEVNSANWTGQEPDDTRTAAPQVCGEFHDKARLDQAMTVLQGSMFQRADLSVRVPGREDDRSYSGQETPVQEEDARNLRTLGTALGTAGVALGTAAAVVASGGAALPAGAAAAAAVAAGGGTMAASEGLGQVIAPHGKTAQDQAAEHGGVVLMVHAATPDRIARAEEVMRACGATRVWRQDKP